MLEINLRPREYKPPKAKRVVAIGLKGPLTILFLIILALAALSYLQINKKSEIKALQAELDSKRAAVQTQMNLIENLENASSDLNNKIKILKKLDKDRSRWVELMNAINISIPEGMWLTGVEEKSIISKVTDLRKATMEEQQAGKTAPRLKSKSAPGAATTGPTVESKLGVILKLNTLDPETVSKLMNNLMATNRFSDFEIESAKPIKVDRWNFLEVSVGCIYAQKEVEGLP